ncbi:MAG: FtsX-like permease family protein [Thermogemmata sp.]|nr:FtsX-like permease family protein [Thermogemmata sp.]
MYAAIWAVRHLQHRGRRTLTAVAGIAFAAVLIFLEIGFLEGVNRTATLLFDQLRFDLLVTSSEYQDLSRTAAFPRQRMIQAAAAEGVVAVYPLSMGFAQWRMPRRSGWLTSPTSGGDIGSIAVLAVPPEHIPFVFRIGPDGVFPSLQAAEQAARLLSRRQTFLMDQRSKPEYGSVDYWLEQCRRSDPADPVVFNDRSALIAGSFTLGTGFCWNALLLTSESTFSEYLFPPPETIHFALIQLESTADIEAVQQQLQAALPPDVHVWTRAAITTSERNYWVRLTSVGQFLTVAVLLVVVVGIIFVYQLMAADIRAMLPEYATIKAIGHSPAFAAAVVLWQAVFLAVLGFVPAWGCALLLYALARDYGGIPASMTLPILAMVACLTIGMCLLSGLLALRKVHRADPADLF